MGVGYSVPKESKLGTFMAISLESANTLAVLEPSGSSAEEPAKEKSDSADNSNGKDEEPEDKANKKDRDSTQRQQTAGEEKKAADNCGLVLGLLKKNVSIERILRRGEQHICTLGPGFSSFSSATQLGSPQPIEYAEQRDFLAQLIGMLDGNGYRLQGNPYTGKLFVRNTLIFAKEEQQKTPEKEEAFLERQRLLWIGIRSKNVLQLSQQALLESGHCCLPATEGSEGESPLLRWIRAEFSGSHIVHTSSAGSGPKFTEVHFQGTPFAAQKFEELITPKRLLLGLFRHMQARGFVCCAQLSVRGNGRNDTLFFGRRQQLLHHCLASPRPPESPQPQQKQQLFLVSFESKCHLRLFECPSDAAQAIEQSFAGERVKQIRPSWMGCAEIVFSSAPFWADVTQLIETQLSVLDMLRALWRVGWRLCGNVQFGQNTQDKGSLLFESFPRPPATQPGQQQIQFLGLSTAKADHLRLLDVPKNERAIIRQLVESDWERGIQEEFAPLSAEGRQKRALTLKLRGRPWSCRDTSLESASALHLLVLIAERLHALGWRLLCTLDVGSKVNDEDDAHLHCEDGELWVFYSTDPFDPDARRKAAVEAMQEKRASQQSIGRTESGEKPSAEEGSPGAKKSEEQESRKPEAEGTTPHSEKEK